MKFNIFYGLLFSVLIFGVTTGHAQTNINIVVTPDTPVFGANNVDDVYADAAPGYPEGSFASNGVGKTDMYFPPAVLFERPVTLDEIATMSYWTKKGATHVAEPGDWYINIYTEPYSGDCSSPSWYGDRIGTEPYFSIYLNAPAGTWNQWSTNGAENRLRFFESTQGCTGANFGSYTDPDWSHFVASLALSGESYAGQQIKFFSVQTASAWAAGFTGQLDGLRIELTDGSVATINFEPRPAVCLIGAEGTLTLNTDNGAYLACDIATGATIAGDGLLKVEDDCKLGLKDERTSPNFLKAGVKLNVCGDSADGNVKLEGDGPFFDAIGSNKWGFKTNTVVLGACEPCTVP